MSQDKNRGKRQKPAREKPEFDQTIVDLARVTRVTKGGKQMSFRACVLIGDRRGRVGYGVDKGKDVQIAVDKAVNQAKKNMITVPFNDVTIPHRVEAKFKAARVMIKPAPQGSGIIAGSSIRLVLELAGVPNASAKKLGKTPNKISNIKATFEALQSFKPFAVQRMMNAKKAQPVKPLEEERKPENAKNETRRLAAPRKKIAEVKKDEPKSEAVTVEKKETV
jgi:small subunit ribosomal protein S5